MEAKGKSAVSGEPLDDQELEGASGGGLPLSQYCPQCGFLIRENYPLNECPKCGYRGELKINFL